MVINIPGKQVPELEQQRDDREKDEHRDRQHVEYLVLDQVRVGLDLLALGG
jgi:hypothetical protein